MVNEGLDVSAVSVEYEARARNAPVQAVKRVSMTVAPGEVVALLGPSGCGKSTLLRAVAGLEPLAHGSVSWNGQDLERVPAHRRGFGMMFQDGQLFQHLNVADNIAYGLRVKGMPAPDRRTRVNELLRMIGLEDMGAKAVTELSGGQQQRVALARSLAPQPKLLLLDAPLSSLDKDLRTELAVELARLLRATQTTAILVTHDESEAQTIADRIFRMRDGEIMHPATATRIDIG